MSKNTSRVPKIGITAGNAWCKYWTTGLLADRLKAEKLEEQALAIRISNPKHSTELRRRIAE